MATEQTQYDLEARLREPIRTATEAEDGRETVDPRRPEPPRTGDHAEGDPDKPPPAPPERSGR